MRTVVVGAVFGLIAIWFGLFVGLQVNVVLGQLLVLPAAVVATLSGVPIMKMPLALWIIAIALQCLTWALIFHLLGRLAKMATGRNAD
ncbi:MAG: hypothetical protein AAGD43_32470 [Pseudomonadota bacterium]